jgi:hypothetical protein
MLDSVAQRGYGATNVPQVVAAARVLRSAFWEATDWRTSLHASTRRYLRWWQDRPQEHDPAHKTDALLPG